MERLAAGANLWLWESRRGRDLDGSRDFLYYTIRQSRVVQSSSSTVKGAEGALTQWRRSRDLQRYRWRTALGYRLDRASRSVY